MQEPIFYLDSLNINDLTLPTSTWLYRDGDNSAEALLLICDLKFLKIFLEISQKAREVFNEWANTYPWGKTQLYSPYLFEVKSLNTWM